MTTNELQKIVRAPRLSEAVARLKADGRIDTRQGAGAFVARMPQRLNFRFRQAESARPALAELHDIFELRAMIETSVAELAVGRDLGRNTENFPSLSLTGGAS
jgi:DNA-binding FadR family transcriptional regulator